MQLIIIMANFDLLVRYTGYVRERMRIFDQPCLVGHAFWLVIVTHQKCLFSHVSNSPSMRGLQVAIRLQP